MVIVCIVVYSVAKAWRNFSIEDSIHAEFYPLISALDQFCDKNHRAPETLNDLVPEYLNEIPSLRRVSEVRYRSEPNEPRWRLTLVSQATGDLRYYIADAGIPLSEADSNS